MKVKLSKTIAPEFYLKHVPKATELAEAKLNLGFKQIYPSEQARRFDIQFHLNLLVPEGYELQVVYTAIFSTEEDIDEQFKASDFPRVNAPAVAYPFLRAFVGQLSLNAGYKAILLPSINFTEFKQ